MKRSLVNAGAVRQALVYDGDDCIVSVQSGIDIPQAHEALDGDRHLAVAESDPDRGAGGSVLLQALPRQDGPPRCHCTDW
ncbi:MAG: hypothetical protein ACFCUP_11665 [Actinomycetales bacterium]